MSSCIFFLYIITRFTRGCPGWTSTRRKECQFYNYTSLINESKSYHSECWKLFVKFEVQLQKVFFRTCFLIFCWKFYFSLSHWNLIYVIETLLRYFLLVLARFIFSEEAMYLSCFVFLVSWKFNFLFYRCKIRLWGRFELNGLGSWIAFHKCINPKLLNETIQK